MSFFVSCELPSYPLLIFLLGCTLFQLYGTAPRVAEEYERVVESVTEHVLLFL